VNTATSTVPTTAPADRFRCESAVPDPPRDPAGRKQYWEDTVAEAVAELRRRLASQFDQKSFEALQMILDLEKTRLRHKAPVAGTQVGGGRWADGLEPLPLYAESDRDFALKKVEKKDEDLTPPVAPATLSVPERVDEPVPSPNTHAAQENDVPLNTPSPERGGSRGVGSSAPHGIDSRKKEEVGPDGLTADQRSWIQEGHDYYNRPAAARDAGVRLLW